MAVVNLIVEEVTDDFDAEKEEVDRAWVAVTPMVEVALFELSWLTVADSSAFLQLSWCALQPA